MQLIHTLSLFVYITTLFITIIIIAFILHICTRYLHLSLHPISALSINALSLLTTSRLGHQRSHPEQLVQIYCHRLFSLYGSSLPIYLCCLQLTSRNTPFHAQMLSSVPSSYSPLSPQLSPFYYQLGQEPYSGPNVYRWSSSTSSPHQTTPNQ